MLHRLHWLSLILLPVLTVKNTKLHSMWLTCHFDSNQTEEIAVQQDNGAPGKKKRKKKKKKAKVVGEDENAESEGPAGYQEPPKFEVIKILTSILINCQTSNGKSFLLLVVLSG